MWPGWMFTPSKPYPFGKYYHTTAYALSKIIYRIDIIEGKYRPQEMVMKDFK